MELRTWRWGLSRERAALALERARDAPIASARDGKRECIRGRVARHDTLVPSPLTGTPCVHWMLELAEDIGSDLVERGTCSGACSFLVTDDSGTARVIPARPIVLAPQRRVDRSSRISGPHTTEVDRCLAAFGPELRFVCTQAVLELREYLVVPEMDVKLLGDCTHEPDPDAAADVTGYRDQLPSRPVLSGTRREPLLIGVEPIRVHVTEV